MTFGQHIAWDDTVLPFQLDASDMRGRVARLDGVLNGILSQHDYPPQVEALVAHVEKLALVRHRLVNEVVVEVEREARRRAYYDEYAAVAAAAARCK